FELLNVVGRGCMGKVFVARDVRDGHNGKLVAIKSICKDKAVELKEITHSLFERDILSLIASSESKIPFLMTLHAAFQTPERLFLVLDFVAGGDLATQLSRHYRFNEETVLFYAVEIIIGLAELHRLGVIYRDLKPENCLLRSDGHLVLTDFGLSKRIGEPAPVGRFGRPRTATFCGTAEYLAPEVLKGEPYGFAIDWWALGTSLYEMISGFAPFWASDHAGLYHRVMHDQLLFPDPNQVDMSDDFKSLLSGLLEKEPQIRLGSLPSRGVREITEHRVFASVDWDTAKKMQWKQPPIIPELTHELDLSYFEDAFTKLPVDLTPARRPSFSDLQEEVNMPNNIQEDPFVAYDFVMPSHEYPRRIDSARLV
ncbi:kinase-like protein, partial [Ramicandelaber brevisporus]